MVRDVFGLIGKTLHDRVRVDQVIAEGGFAVVYKGHHVGFEETVAVKCLRLPVHYTSDIRAEVLQRFREEGKLLFRLSQHPNIVRVFDIGDIEVDGGESVPYLVLEWLDGPEVAQVLSDRAVNGLPAHTESEALELMRPVVDALAMAHGIGVAHRDLKPENLIVTQGLDGDQIKILDFGIAKVMQVGETSASRAVLTTGSFRAFSPAYGAPEQFRRSHGATGPWTDVHALGLILTELVVGRPAWDGEEFGDFYDLAMAEHRPTPRRLGANVSDAFEGLCSRCLALDPRDRFQDAAAVLAEIDSWDGRERVASSPPPASGGLADERASQGSGQPLSVETATTVPFEKSSISIDGMPSLAAIELPAKELEELDRRYPPTAPGSSDGPRSRDRARATTTSSLSTTSSVRPAEDIGQQAERSTASHGGSRRGWWLSGAAAGVVVLGAGFAVWWSARSNKRALDVSPCLPVPGGDFDMGSAIGSADQTPVHRVHVAPFCLDATEVTVKQYGACVGAGICSMPDHAQGVSAIATEQKKWSSLCNWGKDGRGKHPINCVSWDDARKYCRWVGKRLPTETQWEFAARGGDALRSYPWGQASLSVQRLNACDQRCVQGAQTLGWTWHALLRASDGWATTAPVGSFPKGDGLWRQLDLAGNVWEWTASVYCRYATEGPGKCKDNLRVARGGGWASKTSGLFRGTNRAKYPRDYRSPLLGFRCARIRARVK